MSDALLVVVWRGSLALAKEQERPEKWARSLAVVARVVAVAVVFDGGRVDAAGRGALLGRRSGRARRGMCWGGGVSGVGARVVDVQGLAVEGSVVCIFWTDGMQRSENFLSGAVGWFHVFV